MAEEVVKAGERDGAGSMEGRRRREESQPGQGGPSSRGVWFIFGRGRGPLFLSRPEAWLLGDSAFPVPVHHRKREGRVGFPEAACHFASAVSSRFYAALKIARPTKL